MANKILDFLVGFVGLLVIVAITFILLSVPLVAQIVFTLCLLVFVIMAAHFMIDECCSYMLKGVATAFWTIVAVVFLWLIWSL